MISVRALRKTLRAGGPALRRSRRVIKLTTVDLRFVGRESEDNRAVVSEAVSGVSFAARGGVVESLALPATLSFSHSYKAYDLNTLTDLARQE